LRKQHLLSLTQEDIRNTCVFEREENSKKQILYEYPLPLISGLRRSSKNCSHAVRENSAFYFLSGKSPDAKVKSYGDFKDSFVLIKKIVDE
jgi:hypothetical protein